MRDEEVVESEEEGEVLSVEEVGREEEEEKVEEVGREEEDVFRENRH